MKIILGLGSNLGARLQNLREAVRLLEARGMTVRAKSDVFETEPWGGVEQPSFLNACVKMELFDEKSPLEILKIVKDIECEMGRVKNVRWGARLIDIDILLIDDIVYESETLTVPHAEIKNRAFVLHPLSQICGERSEWKMCAEKFDTPTRVVGL